MKFEDVLNKDGYLVYTNKGVSMLPWIHEGKDIITIEKLNGNPKKWDVVFFRRPGITGRGEYVLHRVMKVINDDTYYIIGDNTMSGEIAKREDILGILKSITCSEKTINVSDRYFILMSKLWWFFIWPVITFVRHLKPFIRRLIHYDWIKKHFLK